MGWVYNLRRTDPNSSISEVIAISLVFAILALLAVCLRFYVRLRSKRLPWYDDYAALASSLLTLGYAGIAVAQTRWGQGLTAAYFPPENTINFSKIQYAGGPVYCLDVLGFKLALLTSYLRIAGVVNQYRKIIIGAIVLCVINQLIFAFIISISCIPASAKQWNSSLKGHCIQTQPFYFALGGTSITLDVIIITLPLPVLWRLQLRTKQKILLVALFALGFFVTVVQVIRILTVKDLKNYTDSKNIVIWSCVEISLGVVVSCIPTYGPLFKEFASTVNSYRNRQSGRSYQLGSMPKSHCGPGNSRRISEFEIMAEDEGTTITTIASGDKKGIKDTDSEEHILSGNDDLEVRI
ncbi:hypothetical protein N7493_011820 [Penicillium malachiteum]|uniref:Rhodopsin domain-containing protein n=1 Tax=Penicillium malachiteum TaxID=1324776 RepID=A0AAD6MQ65_9EURO|nr:hypothetical protein N7493_011820 [Penicillium malachiteum]